MITTTHARPDPGRATPLVLLALNVRDENARENGASPLSVEHCGGQPAQVPYGLTGNSDRAAHSV